MAVDQEGIGLDVPCPSCGRDVRVPERSDEAKPPKPFTPPLTSKQSPSPSPRPSAASSKPASSIGMTFGQAKAIIVILVIGLFVVPFFHSIFTQVAPPQQWEYIIVSVPDDSFTKDMNQYGDAGWELVFARRASDGDTYMPTFSYEMIFKRPKRL